MQPLRETLQKNPDYSQILTESIKCKKILNAYIQNKNMISYCLWWCSNGLIYKVCHHRKDRAVIATTLHDLKTPIILLHQRLLGVQILETLLCFEEH